MICYEELPTVNQKMFLMDKKVVILKIIKEFNIAKVKYINCNVKFFVDIHALGINPDMTNTISIKVLGGIG